jgi:hypothetical protein
LNNREHGANEQKNATGADDDPEKNKYRPPNEATEPFVAIDVTPSRAYVSIVHLAKSCA